jgi:hypothetical protein
MLSGNRSFLPLPGETQYDLGFKEDKMEGIIFSNLFITGILNLPGN